MNKQTFVILTLLIYLPQIGWNQTHLQGRLTFQENGSAADQVNVLVFKQGAFLDGTVTDSLGTFSLPLSPGLYDIEFNQDGKNLLRLSDIQLKEVDVNRLDLQLIKPEETVHHIVPTTSKPVVSSAPVPPTIVSETNSNRVTAEFSKQSIKIHLPFFGKRKKRD